MFFVYDTSNIFPINKSLFVGSKKNITYAQCEISKFLNPKGVVIIPANDLLLEETLKEYWKGRVITV